jgi:bleomycin hydrolase
MRILLLETLVFIFLIGNPAFAGHKDDHKKTSTNSSPFTLTIEIPATEVKDQAHTSTCWSFSTLSMLESDILRVQKKAYNLSEMFVIRKVYLEKAERYIRMHGNMNFAGGGEANDVIDVIRKYGIVPEEIYSGLLSDTLKHNHSELDYALKKFVENIISNPDKNLNNHWQSKFNDILDRYLGKIPETFKYQGIQYTPQSFADSLHLNLNNYILISSFNHHPFYKPFILEVPDNWSWGEVYNVPLDEMENIVHYVLTKGSSVVWATDYSEVGFGYNEGMAVAPKVLYDSKRDETKYSKISENEKEKLFFDLTNPVEELNVTQQNRQVAFDNYSTTDDHGMHIVGEAKDSDGKLYFYVKNSWGTDNIFSGYMYVSEPYYLYKTMSIMVDKTFLPDNIRQKLGL